MSRFSSAIVLLTVLLPLGCGGGRQTPPAAGASGSSAQKDLGPFGPSLGEMAPVVRSATLTTSGAVTARIDGKGGDGHTALFGTCNPNMFANFGVNLHSSQYERVEVTLTSSKAIPTGETGEFRLAVLDVTFTTPQYDRQVFRGPGELTLTRHDAAPGARRMTGTMKAEGLKGEGDRTLDATLQFDMDFSCGVKQ